MSEGVPAVESETKADPLASWRDQEGKFLKGMPGGPGRPKGRRDLRTILVDTARQRGAVDADVEDCNTDTRLSRVASKLFDLAEDGDVAAAKLLLDHLADKAPTELLVSQGSSIEDIERRSLQLIEAAARRKLLAESPQSDANGSAV